MGRRSGLGGVVFRCDHCMLKRLLISWYIREGELLLCREKEVLLYLKERTTFDLCCDHCMLKRLLRSWHVRERELLLYKRERTTSYPRERSIAVQEKELLLSVVTTTVEETACIVVC